MSKMMLTGPDQWTEWYEIGVNDYATIYVKGDVFTGAVIVERKHDGVSETIVEIRDKMQHTTGATIPPNDENAWPPNSKWEYRAGIPAGADWSGEASVVIDVCPR